MICSTPKHISQLPETYLGIQNWSNYEYPPLDICYINKHYTLISSQNSQTNKCYFTQYPRGIFGSGWKLHEVMLYSRYLHVAGHVLDVPTLPFSRPLTPEENDGKYLCAYCSTSIPDFQLKQSLSRYRPTRWWSLILLSGKKKFIVPWTNRAFTSSLTATHYVSWKTMLLVIYQTKLHHPIPIFSPRDPSRNPRLRTL